MPRTTTVNNIIVLACCQALTNTANVIILTSAGLAGLLLTEDQGMANLPLALQFLGTAVAAAPASHFMARHGRRTGFITGALCGIAGGALSGLAMVKELFWLLGAGAFLLGVFNGFALYYRFAAAEAASDEYRSRAISLVLAGGVLAAIVGPELAKWSREIFSGQLFAGTYLCVTVLPVGCLLLAPLLKIPRQTTTASDTGGELARPLLTIIRQPPVAVAMLGGVASYGVMAFLMTATPLAMHGNAHTYNDTAFVIQWHVLGMFAPAFVTGHLIRRFGILPIMLAGVALNVLCILVNLLGQEVQHFWAGLFLLGIGWNFLFVGATTLLTEGYTREETAKTQAANELAVFSTMVVATMSSSTILDLFGWQTVNFSTLPILLAICAAILYLHNRTRGAAYPQ